jgi:hypothetical protein
VKLRGLLLLVLTVALAGCGGMSDRSSGPTTATVHNFSETKRHCQGSKFAARRTLQRRKLNADLRRIRTAAATVKGYTQNGNDALNKAVDRFEIDVAGEALPVHARSRYIDRAAALVGPRCYLCFQALEANRPIAAGAKLPCD